MAGLCAVRNKVDTKRDDEVVITPFNTPIVEIPIYINQFKIVTTLHNTHKDIRIHITLIC